MNTKIFYFSGTGNSLYVAKNLATRLDGQYTNVASCVEQTEILVDSDIVGFVFPVYAYTYPKILDYFCKKLKIISNPKYVFIITTYGSTPGRAAHKFAKRLNKYFKVDYTNGVLMPENYIAIFKPDSPKIVEQKINNAQLSMDKICEDIKAQVNLVKNNNTILDYIKTGLVSPIFNFFLLFSHIFFGTNKNCNGCDICVKICPVDNIKKVNNKIKWHNKCIQCMACVNWCPNKCINYTPITKKRLRYTNPHIKITELYKD